ncbi:MAG: phytoene desaturase [Rhodothermaceae bacterium]|nr:phytoene desaturase [Rhodothermaceae bacterium]
MAHRADASLNTRTVPVPLTPESPHAVVIGAGFGGLAAAIRLLVRGYRVTVVDRLDQPGGRARVFKQDGYTFDAGPTLITAPFLFDELWTLAGKHREDYVDVVPITPFYRIRFDDGAVFEYTGDAEAMRREIARFNPADVDGYTRFLEKSERIFEVGFTELGHVPFGSVKTMAEIVPAMMALESWRTVYGLVAKYIKDPRLRQVFSFHPLLVGGNPFSTTSIYTLIAFLERKWGVWYAMGGTGAMVQGMADLIEDLGGTLRFGETVEEITVEGGRATGVRLDSGEHLAADIVVSNADAAWTYKHLIRPEHRTTWTDAKLDRAKLSMSLFVWYFGTDRPYDDIAHHTILLGPRYRGLLQDIFQKHTLADDFSLYLHRPTATDASMAPEGHDCFYVLSPVPHLDSGDPWDEAQNERYRNAIEQYLERTVLPDLSKHVTASLTLNPKGFLNDYLSVKGAAFSFEPVLTQSAYFRPHNASEDVEHLYLVGAGTHPGAGMPGVLSSARVLDTVVPDPDQLVRVMQPSEGVVI